MYKVCSYSTAVRATLYTHHSTTAKYSLSHKARLQRKVGSRKSVESIHSVIQQRTTHFFNDEVKKKRIKRHKMRYNRLELLLAIDEYYDEKFQPYKDDGLYIYGATTFVLYKTRWSQKKMMEFISKAVKHEIEVQNLSEDYIYSDEHQQYPYRWYKDLTCGYRKVVHFDFIHVTYGREEELIPFLQDATCYTTNEIRTTSFAYTDDEVVHNVKDSKDIFYADDQRLEVEKLTRIATWEHNPNDFFNGFEIDSFSKEYFGNVSTPKGIDTKFRKLSMIHHPDKGGNELMFKALSNARRYLKNTKLNSPKAKSIT